MFFTWVEAVAWDVHLVEEAAYCVGVAVDPDDLQHVQEEAVHCGSQVGEDQGAKDWMAVAVHDCKQAAALHCDSPEEAVQGAAAVEAYRPEANRTQEVLGCTLEALMVVQAAEDLSLQWAELHRIRLAGVVVQNGRAVPYHPGCKPAVRCEAAPYHQAALVRQEEAFRLLQGALEHQADRAAC